MNVGRTVVGVGFLTLGGLLLLDRTDVLDAGGLVGDWWPTLVLLGAVLSVLARPPRWASAAVLATIGTALLLVTTGVVEASVWAVLWPLALVALGVWFLVRDVGPRRTSSPAAGDDWWPSSDGRLEVTAVLGGREMALGAEPFRGGSVTAVLGGVELDMTAAELVDGAVLDATAVMGAVELTVPPGWAVLLDGPNVLGSAVSRVPSAGRDAPTLHVRSTAVLGGVEVTLGNRSVPTPLVRPGGATRTGDDAVVVVDVDEPTRSG